jgi:hypothetical protein
MHLHDGALRYTSLKVCPALNPSKPSRASDAELRSRSELVGRRIFVLDGGAPGASDMLARITHKEYIPEQPPARVPGGAE